MIVRREQAEWGEVWDVSTHTHTAKKMETKNNPRWLISSGIQISVKNIATLFRGVLKLNVIFNVRDEREAERSHAALTPRKTRETWSWRHDLRVISVN